MTPSLDQVIRADVVIVGSGVAGQRLALALAPRRSVLLTKGEFGASGSSSWAQGGIAAAVGESDSPRRHKEDTLRVAGGIGLEPSIERLTEGGAEAIAYLDRIGARFSRHPEGGYDLGREAAHSEPRILHAFGDKTGEEVVRALGEQVSRTESIDVWRQTVADDLVVDRGRVVGVVAVNDAGERLLFLGRAVVLATGGLGQVYSCTTNPPEVIGDGLAMAARAGAELVDLEFVQFHPTAIAVDDDPLPLATEALRGAGALLTNERGERVMQGVHPALELAPRDVVAREIFRRREQLDEAVYLDARQTVGEAFPERFPTVFAHCQRFGIDPRTEPIPVTPAAHYHMGGVAVDLAGRSSLSGLWAVGEVASTGVHGANRLASNSLLEGLVFGRAVADDLKTFLVSQPPLKVLVPELGLGPQGAEIERVGMERAQLSRAGLDLAREGGTGHETGIEELSAVRQRIRTLLWTRVGVERSAAGLAEALAELRSLAWVNEGGNAELRNLWTVARLLTHAALARCESRGSHYRADMPALDPSWRVRQVLRLNGDLAAGEWKIEQTLQPLTPDRLLPVAVAKGGGA